MVNSRLVHHKTKNLFNKQLYLNKKKLRWHISFTNRVFVTDLFFQE